MADDDALVVRPAPPVSAGVGVLLLAEGDRVWSRRPFDATMGARIVEWVSQGKSLETLTENREFPSALTIRRWREESSEFGRAMREAEALCADVYASRVLVLSEQMEPDKGAKGYVWAAERLAPERWGSRGGDTNVSVSLTLDDVAKVRRMRTIEGDAAEVTHG